MLSSGLVGVSTQTSFVRPGRIACADRVDVGDRRRAVLEPPDLLDLVEQPERAAVRVVGDHHVVAGAAGGADEGVLGGQPGGEREAALALLQRRDVALEGGAGGVGRAAVLVAAAQPADAVLLVGRGRVDRRDHRAGHRVGLVAGMDGAGLETGLVPVLLLAHGADPTWHGLRPWIHVRTPQDHPAHRRRGAARPRGAPFPLADRHVVLDAPVRTDEVPEGLEVAIFGLGCFWGAEEIYWQLPGVWSTSVGYAGGVTPHPSYEEVCSGRTGHTEAVRVVFDPSEVSYADLVKGFFEIHDPTQGMRQGNDVGTQYRSAIYFTTPEQEEIARKLTEVYGAELERAGSARSPPRSARADVLLRRGRAPAVPREEPVRLPVPLEHGREVPGDGLTRPLVAGHRRPDPWPLRAGPMCL